jgi:phage shock protein PspC (stress-responsive transcriptional regulator)
MSADSETQHQNPAGEAGQQAAAESRPPIRRAASGRMLAGVAAGLARTFGVDVNIIRIGFAVLAILGIAGSSLGIGGIPLYLAGIPLYLACWLLIPEEGQEHSIAAHLLSSVHSRSSR